MPYLCPADRAALLGPVGPCSRCGGNRVRHYCRSCDQFFDACACDGAPGGETHLEHRVYLWTPSGVLAIPNFDELH